VHADDVVLRRGDSITELYVDGMVRAARAAKAAPVDEALITVEKPASRKNSKEVGPETYASIVRTAPRFIDNTVASFEVYPGSMRVPSAG
jgi:hypothetical protein